jgi:hypothetical protein
MKLKELQTQFANHIYNSENTKIFSEITNHKASIADRMQVYRNNVFGNFESVLEIIYPTTKQIVGEGYFYSLSTLYHQKYYSESGNLDEYGKYFSTLIRSLEKEHNLAYLKDIANLEWKYHWAYFGKDVPVFDLEKFQKLKQKDLFKLKFKLHPSCQLIHSKYPIYSIWNFASVKNKKLNLKELSKEYVLVERANWQVNIHSILESDFWFLKQIKNKKNIFQIYKDLNKKYPNFDIGSSINKYISIGVLSKFY